MKQNTFLYVSLWDHNAEKTKGLAIYGFDEATGAISHIKTICEDTAYNQSLVDYAHNILYINNETEHVPDVPYTSGRIFGYRMDGDTGELTEVFRRPTGCPSPCYLELSENGKYLVSSHHSCPESITTLRKGEDGTWQPVALVNDSAVMLFERNEDGTLGALLDVKKHGSMEACFDGKGHPTNNHPHSCLRAPLYHDLFCVPDKGDGQVYMYTIDQEKHELVLCDRVLSDVPGSKARYCAYHPTLPYLFVNHENLTDGDMHVSVFRYDEQGHLERLGVYKGLLEAPDQSQICSQQGLCIHPSGKYLYSICRNPAVVIVFEIDQETGALRVIQNAPVAGSFPRGIAISPDGRFVVTSCLFSPDLAVSAVGEDGTLTPTGHSDRLLGGSYVSFYQP